MKSIGIIILAAGASLRLGQPKQLLQYNGRSLLRQAADIALQIASSCVIAVLGSNAQLLSNEVAYLPIEVVENKNWEEGMASSIRCGISAILKFSPGIDNVIIMVCDQPFITASLLQNLMMKQKETSKNIVACSYNNTLGTPVLYNKIYFTELLNLKGADGAKKLINKYRDDVSTVSFPLGYVDVDTTDDYEELLQNFSGLP